jgi:hypothetical protein
MKEEYIYEFESENLFRTLHTENAKVKQSRYRRGVAQRVPGIKVPRFHDSGTEWW